MPSFDAITLRRSASQDAFDSCQTAVQRLGPQPMPHHVQRTVDAFISATATEAAGATLRLWRRCCGQASQSPASRAVWDAARLRLAKIVPAFSLARAHIVEAGLERSWSRALSDTQSAAAYGLEIELDPSHLDLARCLLDGAKDFLQPLDPASILALSLVLNEGAGAVEAWAEAAKDKRVQALDAGIRASAEELWSSFRRSGDECTRATAGGPLAAMAQDQVRSWRSLIAPLGLGDLFAEAVDSARLQRSYQLINFPESAPRENEMESPEVSGYRALFETIVHARLSVALPEASASVDVVRTAAYRRVAAAFHAKALTERASQIHRLLCGEGLTRYFAVHGCQAHPPCGRPHLGKSVDRTNPRLSILDYRPAYLAERFLPSRTDIEAMESIDLRMQIERITGSVSGPA